MPIFNISSGGGAFPTSQIDTAGGSQPISAAQNPSPLADSVPASLNAGSTSTSDAKAQTATTLNWISNRA
jgi:hypothetical protein